MERYEKLAKILFLKASAADYYGLQKDEEFTPNDLIDPNANAQAQSGLPNSPQLQGDATNTQGAAPAGSGGSDYFGQMKDIPVGYLLGGMGATSVAATLAAQAGGRKAKELAQPMIQGATNIRDIIRGGGSYFEGIPEWQKLKLDINSGVYDTPEKQAKAINQFEEFVRTKKPMLSRGDTTMLSLLKNSVNNAKELAGRPVGSAWERLSEKALATAMEHPVKSGLGVAGGVLGAKALMNMLGGDHKGGKGNVVMM